MSLTQGDTLSSLQDHLENKGYKVYHDIDPNGLTLEVTAVRGRETFIIECIWENYLTPQQSITYALGKIVKRMKRRDPWTDYGLAMPKTYFKILRNFEDGGFEALKLHLLLVENVYQLIHLNAKVTLELIGHLKTDNLSTMHIWGINYQ